MYSDAERMIYRYSDGKRDRVADPLAVEATYMDALAGENLRGLNQQLASELRRARVNASAKMLPAIRLAFDVAEFDEATGEGLPLAETHDLTRRFFAFKAEVRRRYRTLARFTALYGHVPGRPLPYEAFVGLTWNLEGVAAIQAVQVARGIATALSGSPHFSVIDAMAERESQIESIADAVESERIDAEERAHVSAGKM